MHNIWLIAKREYLERVHTKAFVVSTILIPLLMGGGIIGSAIMDGRTRSNSHIAVVSKDTQLVLDLQKELQSGKHSKMVVDSLSPGPNVKQELDAELASRDLDGYLWITPANSQNSRPTFTYTPRSTADIITKSAISVGLHDVLMREQLEHRGMVSGDVDALMQPVEIKSTNVDTDSAFYAAYVLFFLMYFVIMMYGMNVARSIIEEKTSRIFEILLATIRPEEMMAGKVIGVGSVGLTQVALWLLTAGILTSTSLVSHLTGVDSHIPLSLVQILFFILYFILGFLLYSSIAAALGAMTNSEQELQQLNMFLVMPLAACLFALPVVVSNSNGVTARILSMIPFCTPLVMYLRISISMPHPWEILLSILIMMATTWGILWIASRIYRVGVLMYGKRPNLPEIVRWLKYS